jgi:hypothetical protein
LHRAIPVPNRIVTVPNYFSSSTHIGDKDEFDVLDRIIRDSHLFLDNFMLETGGCP